LYDFSGFWECPFLFPGGDGGGGGGEVVAPYGDGGVVVGCADLVVGCVW